jgi:diguanylate cyclase (GGDEF)-like protein/PAS domain S-box-containing protein
LSVAPRPGSDAPTDRRTAAAGDPLAGAGFEDAPVALAITDSTGNWVRVNRMLCELLGHTAEELLGTSYRALTLPEDLAADDAATEAMLAAGGRGEPVEKRLRHADGRLLWVRVTATLLRDAEGLPWGAIAGIEDIDARRLRDAELARLALHDPLTGVRNRALLDDDIDAALQARDRDGGVVAVCYLDVDDFKDVNDRYGHEVGDFLLVVLATRLRDVRRETDTVARLGGDEFALVAHLPDADAAERLRQRVERACAEPLVMTGLTVPLAVSVGITVIDRPGHTAAGVLAAADTAMYQLKRQRRDAPSTPTPPDPMGRGTAG